MYALALAASLPWFLAQATPRELVYSYSVERSQTDQGDTAHGVDKMDPGGGGTFYFHNNARDYRPPPAGGGDAGVRARSSSTSCGNRRMGDWFCT